MFYKCDSPSSSSLVKINHTQVQLGDVAVYVLPESTLLFTQGAMKVPPIETDIKWCVELASERERRAGEQ